MVDAARINEMKSRVESAKIKYGIPKESECKNEILFVFGVLAKAMYSLGIKEFSLHYTDSREVKVIGVSYE